MNKTVHRAIASDFLFDLQTFSDGLLAALRRTAAGALQAAGSQLLEELGKTDDPFTMTPEAVLNFHRLRENKLKDVPDEIFQQIKDSLEEGLNLGETIDELSDRVRAEFNGISDERARTIAMTETAAAYGQGRDAAMQQAGVRYKKWLTSGNANVRPGHAAANQQTVEIDQPFQVRNSEGIIEELMMPGDPNGSPSNVINCHCVAIAVAPPKEDQT